MGVAHFEMMATYTATFASHYGALRCKKYLEEKGVMAYLRPVPRSLSASCGTCVVYEASTWDIPASFDVEGVYQKKDERYVCMWRNT